MEMRDRLAHNGDRNARLMQAMSCRSCGTWAMGLSFNQSIVNDLSGLKYDIFAGSGVPVDIMTETREDKREWSGGGGRRGSGERSPRRRDGTSAPEIVTLQRMTKFVLYMPSTCRTIINSLARDL